MNSLLSKISLTEESSSFEGGAKKPKRKPKSESSSASKPKPKQKPKSKSTSTSKKAKGGAILDDVKNLAVPFAILLAKQGLQHMFDNTKNENKKSALQKSESKSTSSKSPARQSPARKSVKVGGSCGSQCATAAQKKGGSSSDAVKVRFEKLSKEIDSFLQKY